MIKWGAFDHIDSGLLRQAEGLLRREQAAHGQVSVMPGFNPAALIADRGTSLGMAAIESANTPAAFGLLALTFFFIGYNYRLGEEGHLHRLLAEINEQTTETGGAHAKPDGS